jgi:hypothetical protein
MSDKSSERARPLIGFITRENAPQISPAPVSRTWMSKISETRKGWPNRCLPMLIANQSGWELRNPCAFTATWFGQENGADVMIVPDKRDADQLLPVGHFGSGILTWNLPLLFRTPPGYNLLVRGPANYPKDGVCPIGRHSRNRLGKREFQHELETHPQTDTGAFRGRRADLHDSPQRRAELEEFTPELRRIESDEDLQRKYELFRRSRDAEKQIEQVVRVTAGEQVEWQGDYTRGRHTDGEAGTPDHQTRRHLRSFVQPQDEKRR